MFDVQPVKSSDSVSEVRYEGRAPLHVEHPVEEVLLDNAMDEGVCKNGASCQRFGCETASSRHVVIDHRMGDDLSCQHEEGVVVSDHVIPQV